MARKMIPEGTMIIANNMTYTIKRYDTVSNRYYVDGGSYFDAEGLQRMLNSGKAKLREARI